MCTKETNIGRLAEVLRTINPNVIKEIDVKFIDEYTIQVNIGYTNYILKDKTVDEIQQIVLQNCEVSKQWHY